MFQRTFVFARFAVEKVPAWPIVRFGLRFRQFHTLLNYSLHQSCAASDVQRGSAAATILPCRCSGLRPAARNSGYHRGRENRYSPGENGKWNGPPLTPSAPATQRQGDGPGWSPKNDSEGTFG